MRSEVTKDYIDYILRNNEHIAYAVYQLEQSNEDDIYSQHWQMTVAFGKPMNSYQVKGILQMKKGEYRAPVTNIEASLTYCKKSFSRVKGPYDYSRPSILNALRNL